MATKKKNTTRKKAAKKNIRKPARKTAGAKKKSAKKTSSRGVARVAHSAQSAVQAAASSSVAIQHYGWRREHYTTLREFWPFYLHEHSRASNRLLHFIGSSLGLAILAIAIGISQYILIIPALVSGYAFAWFGHFFIEKNRPATFKYPLKSFISDWRMWYAMLTGRIRHEMQKYGITSR